MNFDEEGARRIIFRLQQLSDEGRMAWEQYAGSVYEFEAGSDSFQYYIASLDQDDNAPFRLQLFRQRPSEGLPQIVDEIITSRDAPYNSGLERLYKKAKLAAMRYDTIVDDILRDLE